MSSYATATLDYEATMQGSAGKAEALPRVGELQTHLMLAGNAEVPFPGEAPDPRLASVRRFVTQAAERAGLPEDRVFDLTLAASEACANALEHGRGCDFLTVSARQTDEALHVEILSPGKFELHPCRRKVPHERGFGLPLMIALTDEVTFTRRRDGGCRVRLTAML